MPSLLDFEHTPQRCSLVASSVVGLLGDSHDCLKNDEGSRPHPARWSPSACGFGCLSIAVCTDLGDTAPVADILADVGARPPPVRRFSAEHCWWCVQFHWFEDPSEQSASSSAEVNTACGDTELGTARPARFSPCEPRAPGRLVRLTSLAASGERRNHRFF